MTTPEEVQDIADKLHRVGADNPCPRCRHTHFDVVADGYVMLSVEVDATAPNMFSVLAMPCVPVCCAKCGWVSLHSKVRLDLLAKAVSEPAAEKREP